MGHDTEDEIAEQLMLFQLMFQQNQQSGRGNPDGSELVINIDYNNPPDIATIL